MKLIKKDNIALLLAISSISGIITPTITSLKEISSYAYTNEYNLTETEKIELNIKKVITGNNYTIYLKEDGSVWGCGMSQYGQLGTGNRDNQLLPIQLPITDVKDVICGTYNTIFIKNDGSAWGTGENSYAELGIGNTTMQLSPVQIPITDVKEIIFDTFSTFFLKNDGTVWSCGENVYGQLGIGNKINQNTPVKVPVTNVNKIVANARSAMFLKEDGTVWSCGWNYSGQLGIGNNIEHHYTPVQVKIDNVKDVVMGDFYTIFLKEDGTVWACGYNFSAQLGIGNNTNQNTPVKVDITGVKEVKTGGSHTIVVKQDESIWGWGYNSEGQLGLGDTKNQYTPVQIPITEVKSFNVFRYNTMFLKEDGTVWVCGDNYYGQLGIGNNIDQKIITKSYIDNVTNIFGNPYTIIFNKNNGTFWGCGQNDRGQLGIDNQVNQNVPVQMNSSLYTTEELVLQAEQSKSQSDFDIAFNKVDKLIEGQEKTNLLDRLTILQVEINNIKKATDLLVLLEQNKLKNNISTVQNSINLITDITIKKQLQDRLDIVKNEINQSDINYSKLLQNASSKLEKAQSSKNNTDITFAQLAIDKLNPDDKDLLQEQLNNLKETIKLEKEIEDYNKLLEDAEIKTTKAENSKKDYEITVAQNSINKLKDIDKPQFQDRLDNLVYNILLEDANVKVVTAEELRTDTSINIAQIAVDKVPHNDLRSFSLLETELLEKPILQSKLDSLKLSIEEERYLKLKGDANTKVTTAEETKTLKDIKLAQLAIDRLKEVDKTELQIRLDALNQLIKDEEKEKNAILLATTKVEQAEKMDNTKYLEEAKELVDSLKPSEDKELLLERLTALESSSTKTDEKTKTLIYQAEVYLKQAEALKRQTYITKAQSGIDKIPEGNPEKALLQARLDNINVKK